MYKRTICGKKAGFPFFIKKKKRGYPLSTSSAESESERDW